MKQYKCDLVILINMVLTTIINTENHKDFRIVPEKNGTVRQFILTRYGRSYNIHDNGRTHYLNLCESMCYPFGVEPGHYKADINGDSIYIQPITEEEFNRCTPKKNDPDDN